MTDLLMCLLLNLKNHGKITEVNMYKSGTFSTITIDTCKGIYHISISKEDEIDGNG